MKKFIQRTLTGAIYVGLIVGALLLPFTSGAFTLLCIIAAVVAIPEFYRMTRKEASLKEPSTVIDLLIAIAIILFPWVVMVTSWGRPFVFGVTAMSTAIITLIAFRVVMQLYRHIEDPVTDLAQSAMAILYIALPLTAAQILCIVSGSLSVLLIFVMIWLNDTGAFLVGSAIGRNRLFPRLSPKKSWEGFFGGLLFTIAAGCLAPVCFPSVFPFPIAGYAVLAVVVTVMSTFGDLFESMIKRHAGVKDSGNILPGHGGMLDRIDSLLFVMPSALLPMALMSMAF